MRASRVLGLVLGASRRRSVEVLGASRQPAYDYGYSLKKVVFAGWDPIKSVKCERRRSARLTVTCGKVRRGDRSASTSV